MEIDVLNAEQWKEHAELAHLVIFNEKRPASMNRIDFAFLVHEGPIPLGYGTYRELDSENVYMQYGGVFPSAEKSTKAWLSYSLCINRLGEMGYKSANTLIENENIPMLKFAFKKGFRIIGTRTFENKIYCELLKNFRED